MNAEGKMPSSIVGAQVQRLLELVSDYRQKQCQNLLDRAHQQSRDVVRQAHRNARLRLHRDIQETRQQMRREISAARAKQHTMKMQQRHRSDQEFLNQSWEMLTGKLLQRWQDPAQRQLWTHKILFDAVRFLPDSQWQVDHPQDWSQAERNHFRDLANNHAGRELTFNSVSDLAAGIRISANGAFVDGTLGGLMADRVRIESEILAQCRDCIVHSDGEI